MRLVWTTLAVLTVFALVWISLKTRSPRPDTLVPEHQAYSFLKNPPLAFGLPFKETTNPGFIWLRVKLGELNQAPTLCYAYQESSQENQVEDEFHWDCPPEPAVIREIAVNSSLVLIEALDDHPLFNERFRKLFSSDGTRLNFLFLSLSRKQSLEFRSHFPRWLFSSTAADLSRIQLLSALRLVETMTWDFDFYFAPATNKRLLPYWLSEDLIKLLRKRNRFIISGPISIKGTQDYGLEEIFKGGLVVDGFMKLQ